MAVKHKAQRAAAGAVLDQLLKYVDKDPQANLLKLMDKVQGIVGNLFPAKSLEGIRKGAEDPENVWNQFAMSILRDIDRDVIKKCFSRSDFTPPTTAQKPCARIVKNTSAISPGSFCSTQPVPATSNARAAGRRNTAIARA